jgi:hypothetical protein
MVLTDIMTYQKYLMLDFYKNCILSLNLNWPSKFLSNRIKTNTNSLFFPGWRLVFKLTLSNFYFPLFNLSFSLPDQPESLFHYSYLCFLFPIGRRSCSIQFPVVKGVALEVTGVRLVSYSLHSSGNRRNLPVFT